MQLVLEQGAPQGLLDLALAGDGLLPAGEAHDLYDHVDVGDDPLDGHRGAAAPGLIEELGQRSERLALLVLGHDLLLGLDHLFGDL